MIWLRGEVGLASPSPLGGRPIGRRDLTALPKEHLEQFNAAPCLPACRRTVHPSQINCDRDKVENADSLLPVGRHTGAGLNNGSLHIFVVVIEISRRH